MAENSLSDLIKFIGTDVYGREMREHIKEAFEILAQSSLTAEEKAKIADLLVHPPVLYTPQDLTEGEKIVARNNIGAAKAGDSGRGWTEEQINLLESFKEFFDTMKDHIGYDENSADGAGQTAAKNAVDALASLITSLRTIPRELESITVALKEDVTPMNGRSIQLNELEVTGHYSDGTSSTIESGYELSALSDTEWKYPKTTVRAKYSWKGTLYTSPSAEISLSSDAYAWISIDSSSDREHLNYAASIGGAERQFDDYGRIKVLPIDKNSGIIVMITVKSDYSADKELDPSSTATMNGVPMTGRGAGIWGETQIDGNVVIKGMSKNKGATTYTATFVVDGNPYDTVTFEAGAIVLPRVPEVPPKENYTGAWEPYTVRDENFTVNAVYTPVTPTLDRLDVTPLTLTVDDGTDLADLADLLTVNAVYDNETSVTLTYGTSYNLTGSLNAGQTNRIAVSGLGDYDRLSSVNVDVTVEEITVDEMVAVTHDTTYDPTFTFPRDFTNDFVEIVYTIKESPTANDGIIVFICQKRNDTWKVYAKTKSNAYKEYAFEAVITKEKFKISRGTGSTDTLHMSSKDSTTVARKWLSKRTEEEARAFVNEFVIGQDE